MLRFHSTLTIFALALGATNTSAVAQDSSGFVPTRDSTRLFYQKTGRGPRTIIVPGRIFLWPTVRRLADEFTVISYDTRDRGRSDRIDDASKITIQADVDDLEAIRSHFRIEKADVIGYSYMGMMVMLYALQHPDRVDRVVQLGPVPLRWDTQFPPELVNRTPPLVDAAAGARLSALRRDPSATQRDICEAAWAVDRYGLVGDSGHVGLYWKMERRLREAEARLGWLHGVSGAIYALRVELFRPLPHGILLDDLWIPLHVIFAGHSVWFARDAIAWDAPNDSAAVEYRRKLRTLAGNWQLIARLPRLLMPWRNPVFFAWFSHKLLRLLAPWCLLALWATSWLADGVIYRFAFCAQTVAYAVAALMLLAPRIGARIPLAATAASFVMLNTAALFSLPAYLARDQFQLWKKR